jgi:hypothetical protein
MQGETRSAAPEDSRTTADGLVPDLPGLGRALQAVAFPPGDRAVVGWDEFFGVARRAEMQREADAALRAVAKAADATVASAADVLGLIADGRLRKAATGLFGDLPDAETQARIVDLVTLLLALAALRGGVARWRHSWTGTAELVALDGGHLDLGSVAALAADPATVATARERLTDLGIDVTAPGDEGPARTPVVGGVVNVLVGGERTDLLIVETGLLLVPGLPRARSAEAKRRLTRLAGAGIRADGSPARSDPGDPATRFIPFTEIAGATAARRSWELQLHGGQALPIKPSLDADELPGGWSALTETTNYLAKTR